MKRGGIPNTPGSNLSRTRLGFDASPSAEVNPATAFGTPSIASNGLAVDVDTPGFVERLPDDVSPVMVAEAIERTLADPLPYAVREQQRIEYLDRKSPARYAKALLALLDESAGGSR